MRANHADEPALGRARPPTIKVGGPIAALALAWVGTGGLALIAYLFTMWIVSGQSSPLSTGSPRRVRRAASSCTAVRQA